MEYRAHVKNVKVSPRKVRLVADQIRDLSIAKAMIQLTVSPKRGAVSLKKALESAIANAVNNKSANKDGLKIKTINITEGIRYKRYHFAGRGRTRPYVKRTSHIDVIIEDMVIANMQKPVVKADVKPEAVVKDAEIVNEKTKKEVKTKKGDKIK